MIWISERHLAAPDAVGHDAVEPSLSDEASPSISLPPRVPPLSPLTLFEVSLECLRSMSPAIVKCCPASVTIPLLRSTCKHAHAK